MTERPKILWDAHNYLSLDLCAGPAPDDEDYDEVSDEEFAAAQKELEKLKDSSVMIEWDADPLGFADQLEKAAKWLRETAAKMDGSRFHLRTDID